MTNAEARFNNSLCPRKPEGSLGRTAQDVHLTLTQLLNYDRNDVQTALFYGPLLHGWCRLAVLCVHHTTIHPVTSLHAEPRNYVSVHYALRVPCNMPPASFWQNDRDLLRTCYCCNTGVERIPKKKILPPLLPELTRTRDLSIR